MAEISDNLHRKTEAVVQKFIQKGTFKLVKFS